MADKEVKLKTLRDFQKLVEKSWSTFETKDRQPVDYSNERDLKLLEKGRLKRIGPWKRNVAPPSLGTPWPIDRMFDKPNVMEEAIQKGRPDLGLGAEWLAWTSGSRPTKGRETSLKKMGLAGQPKPEIAPKKKSKKDRLEEAVRAGLKEVTKDFVKKKSRKK